MLYSPVSIVYVYDYIIYTDTGNATQCPSNNEANSSSNDGGHNQHSPENHHPNDNPNDNAELANSGRDDGDKKDDGDDQKKNNEENKQNENKANKKKKKKKKKKKQTDESMQLICNPTNDPISEDDEFLLPTGHEDEEKAIIEQPVSQSFKG